jgi:hypothetical protein
MNGNQVLCVNMTSKNSVSPVDVLQLLSGVTTAFIYTPFTTVKYIKYPRPPGYIFIMHSHHV